MAIAAAKLLVQVDADTTGAQNGLKQVENGMQRLKGVGSQIGSVFAGVLGAGAVIAASNGLRSLASAGLQAYVSYERLGASLTALTAKEMVHSGAAKTIGQAYSQAAPQAQKLLGWIQKLAIESPFTQDDVAQAFRMAQAYGFTTEQAQGLTTALINFAAATGQSGDNMQRVAMALGQVQAKGKLAGQEVLQLVNAGIAVDQILAQAFGKSTAEIVEMREKGLIPADQAIQAIVKSLNEDFGGAAQKQATTFAGLISSLEDIKSVGLREFFSGTFDALRPLLEELTNAFTKGTLQTDIRAIGDAFGEFVKNAIQTTRDLISWWKELDKTTQNLILVLGGLVTVGPKAVAALGGLAGVIKGVGGVLAALGGPITLAIAGIGLIGASAVGIKKDIDDWVGSGHQLEYWSDVVMMAADTTVYGGKAHDVAAQKAGKYGQAVGEAGTAATKAGAAIGMGSVKAYEHKQALDEAAAAAAAFAEQQERMAQVALEAGLAGTVMEAMESYKDTIAELLPEHQALTAELQRAIDNGWSPTGRYIEDLNAKLAENEEKQLSAAEAMREATAQMIYQQAAAGLDAEASLQLARALGILSETDFAIAATIQEFRSALDSGKISTELYTTSIAQLNTAVGNLQAAGLPVTIDSIKTALEELSGVEKYDPGELIPDPQDFEAASGNLTAAGAQAGTAFADGMKSEATMTGEAVAQEVSAAIEGADWSTPAAGAGKKIADALKTSALPVIAAQFKKDFEDNIVSIFTKTLPAAVEKGVQQLRRVDEQLKFIKSNADGARASLQALQLQIDALRGKTIAVNINITITRRIITIIETWVNGNMEGSEGKPGVGTSPSENFPGFGDWTDFDPGFTIGSVPKPGGLPNNGKRGMLFPISGEMPLPLPVTVVGGMQPVTVNLYANVNNELDIYRTAEQIGQALAEQRRY